VEIDPSADPVDVESLDQALIDLILSLPPPDAPDLKTPPTAGPGGAKEGESHREE
jgi:hypothetical protein